ncbi:MAG: PAS domain S-box protein [Planctomycetia bacterium]|nr:PAS domain S-box protein [Planctomycetia bacterium]
MRNETQHQRAGTDASWQKRVDDLERQVADYQEVAERLRHLLETPGLAGGAFFQTLVTTLADCLKADYVLVGELNPLLDGVKAPLVYADGDLHFDASYPLAGTPCETVIGARLCTYREGAQEQFPDDELLRTWRIESYIGAPLFDIAGAPLGIVAALWKTPLADPRLAEMALALVASRAAREFERLRVDEALRAGEARFRTFCEAAPLAIFECDERGFCAYMSPHWQRMTGRSPSENLGFGWLSTVHPEDVPDLREAWLRAVGERGPFLAEYRVVTPEGGLRWVRTVARRIGESDADAANYVGCVEDITDRKQAELARAESEERFRAFMDNNPAVAFMKDADGRQAYVNATFLKMFQTGPEPIVGKTDLEMFGPELADRLRTVDQQVLSEDRATQLIETVPTPDGVQRNWLVYKFPVHARSGQTYLGGVAIDISERLLAEEELRKARDELEKRVADRTHSLTATNIRLQDEVLERERADAALRNEQVLLRQLLCGHEADRKLIAYEIHDGLVQYVTAAIMHLESAKQAVAGADRTPAFDTALKLLRDTIQEARRMINGLQPMILDDSGIVPAIEYLIEEQRGSHSIDFEHQVKSGRFSPLLESGLFRICQEALTNARKHSRAARIRVRLTQEHAWIRLEVADDGIGFDPRTLSGKTFGLRGIRERAHLLRGTTTIDSAPGQGTRIVAELPISQLE